MLVKEIMTEEPICCTPDTSIAEAARLMAEFDCGEIPVVESENSDHLIGVITDRDICCRAVAEEMDSIMTTVRECMSSPVVIVSGETDIEDLRRLMEEKQIRRVPVVDTAGDCQGIVTQADLARETSDVETGEVVREISKPGGLEPRI